MKIVINNILRLKLQVKIWVQERALKETFHFELIVKIFDFQIAK